MTLLAPPAEAKVPSVPNCDVPHVLTLVGRSQDGTPDPIGEFQVVVRDLANTPQDGVQVILDFTNCPEDRICTDQSPLEGVDCATHSVIASAVTGHDGVAHLRVVGYSDHHASPAWYGQLRVVADTYFTLSNNVRVASLDQDGGGLGPSDFSAWLDDYFHSPGAMRADLDGDGIVSPHDLSILLTAFFAGGSIHGGGASTCPP